MPSLVYDFDVPAEYSLSGTDLSGGTAALAAGSLTGTVLGLALFQGARLDSVAATETPNGGTLLYGLQIDAVLHYHDGLSWVPSDGTPAQLNTLAELQAQVMGVLGADQPVVRPLVYLERLALVDPSPEVEDLTFTYTVQIPNRQVILATDLAVALNTGIGGAADPGKTRVTLDPAQVVYGVGSGELWVFRNGVLASDYIEEDAAHVVFNTLLDAVGPNVDEMEFRSAQQGSSLFIPPPTFLAQAQPPPRPDNFGGNFEFA